jgi:hypothetical protein
VIVLRRKRTEVSKSYTIPGGYLIPCLALLTCFWLLFQMKLVVIMALFGGMVLSLPIYFYRKRRASVNEDVL